MFKIDDFVVIASNNVRLGQKGRVINRFDKHPELYSVLFLDGSTGYFEESELKVIPWDEVPDCWKDNKNLI